MKLLGDLSVRLARDEDVERVILLDRKLDNLPHWPVGEYRAAVAGGGLQRLRCLFVADAGGEIVGFAVGRVDRIAGECSGELESVGVALSAQRRGIGWELCGSIIGWCQSQGASHVDLEVRSQSSGAVALYTEVGFATAGRRRSYYRDPADDALLMRLDLKPKDPDTASTPQRAP